MVEELNLKHLRVRTSFYVSNCGVNAELKLRPVQKKKNLSIYEVEGGRRASTTSPVLTDPQSLIHAVLYCWKICSDVRLQACVDKRMQHFVDSFIAELLTV